MTCVPARRLHEAGELEELAEVDHAANKKFLPCSSVYPAGASWRPVKWGVVVGRHTQGWGGDGTPASCIVRGYCASMSANTGARSGCVPYEPELTHVIAPVAGQKEVHG